MPNRLAAKLLSKKNKFKGILLKLALYLFLVNIAYVFLYPFIFLILNSFKSPQDLMNPSINWIPSELFFKNFLLAIEQTQYFQRLINSIVITLFSTIGHVFSASLIGYGFSRTKAPCKGLFLILVLITIVIPIQIIIVPLFVQFGNYNWLDTFLPIVIPTFFGLGLSGGIFIFIFKQYYQTLPNELENAAYIDGCGPYSTYLRIILPISRSTVLVCAIISMVWHWNDFYQPMMFLGKQELWPVTAVLPQLHVVAKTAFENLQMLISGRIVTMSVVMAAIILTELPILLIFMLLQRQFMTGIERTGIVE